MGRFKEHFKGSLTNPYDPDSQTAANADSDCPKDEGRAGIAIGENNAIVVQTRYKKGEDCLVARVVVE